MKKKIIMAFALLSISLLALASRNYVGATGGAFSQTKHGGGVTDGETPCAGGVNRGLASDYGGDCSGAAYYNDPEGGLYVSGECNHCHEPHGTFGGAEPFPATGDVSSYLLMKYGNSPESNYAWLCWYCHENIGNINGSGSMFGYGRWSFYQGKAVYENSSHYNSPDMYWPGVSDAEPVWPRKNRSSMPSSNTGSCVNCHTPHGLMEKSASPLDTAAVPTSPTNLHLAANNPSVSSDYLVPRQLIAWEEALCETCHDGSPAIDIKTEIDKRTFSGSGHPVDDTAIAGRHALSEATPVTVKHVECYDCHNPHAAAQPSSGGRLAGVKGVNINNQLVAKNFPGAAENRDPYSFELCLKCHGETFATFIPADKYATPYGQPSQPLRTAAGTPASSNTYGSNKRREFNPASTGAQTSCGAYPASDCNPGTTQNTAYHPVSQGGRNTTGAISRQLLGGLTPTSTIHCTDCHNNDATASSSGPVTESNLRATDAPATYAGASPVGPHGSSPPPVNGYYTSRILRGNYNTTLGIWNGSFWDKPFTSFDRNNFSLCFLCHDEDAFTCQPATESCNWPSGSKTNFFSTGYNVNLHASHVAGKPGLSAAGTYTTCANCHYNVHSNVDAANTMYEDSSDSTWNRTLDGSRLVNFSPIVEPSTFWNYSKPFWGCVYWMSQRKGCDFNCHGFDQELYYTPPNLNVSCQ